MDGRNNRDKPWKRDRYDHRPDRSTDNNRNSHHDRDRTRQKRGRHNYEERHYNQRHYNQYNRDRARWNNDPQVRTIHTAKVELPKEFLINENPQYVSLSEPKFRIKIQKSQKPPMKEQNKLDELKNRITPIEKIWTSHIKQYLNDSQFVEIYRKNKSLAYGNIQYGKTAIKYDEGDKSMYYENQSAQSKIFSRAYFKIWEILSMGVFDGKQNESLTIASVAEGPGGFIHAMIDYRLKGALKKDSFYSITLKIDENTRNAKDWSDYRAKSYFQSMRNIGYTIKLSYGQTETGDLLLQKNADYFADKDLGGKKCFLVTGDGGIECIGDRQFDYQEVFNVKLFLGQILAALKVQDKGGKFILKIYDCSFDLTRQLLTLLCVFYRKVRMVKPVTSRPGNSEKYMLCEDFLGMSQEEQNQLKKLLSNWRQIQPNITYFQNKQFITNIIEFPNLRQAQDIEKKLLEANKYFMDEQSQKLEQGLKLAQENDNDAEKIQQLLTKKRFKQQISYAYAWCKKYGLTPIDVEIEENQDEKQKNQL